MNAFNRLEIASLLRSQYRAEQELQATEVLDVIMLQRFGVEYQPIVEVQAGEVIGHQASACFWNSDKEMISAGKMFAYLHKNPLLLFHTELEMKKLQITHAPDNGLLMLDLDIDSFFEGGEESNNPFLVLFKAHAWSERELVINIVENHNMADAYRSQRVIEMLQQSGTPIALEDIGARWGMFSLSAFMDASIIKFNGNILQQFNHKAAQAMVDWLVSAARRIGVSVVMSGVDSCEQFEWAKRMGVDCVQGSLFDRNNIHIREF
ncbi:MAG TPA: EAL domain-containing protein [Methylophilaceae bacterium]|nr:EAL domain-containing protein [Methylophilaceae bacterium]